jgi:ATP-binding cassette subfamily B protein
MATKPNKEAETHTHLKWYGLPAIFPFLKPHATLLITIIATMAFSSIIDAILPLFQNYAITHFIGDSTIDTLPIFVGLYLALLLAQGLSNAWGSYAANTAEVRVDRDVRQACFDHVQTLSFSYFNQNSVGYIHSRIISDPNRIGQIVSWGLMDVILCLVYIVAIFVVMFLMNPALALLLLCVVPILSVLVFLYHQRYTAQNRKVRELNSIITGDFNEGITGAKTIKSLVIEDRMQADFQKDTGTMRAAAVRAGWYRALFTSGTIFFSSVALALVLWRGGMLTREGLMLVGNLSVFMNYATSLSSNITELVGTFGNFINSQVNIERIMRLLNTKSDVSDTPEVVAQYGDTFHPKKENWEPLDGEIEFKDVTFRYPDGEENVLEHFDLKVPKGSMVAIVGETGAGKSTLVNLVCRFYEPTEGQVLIDGRDARERSQLWLHSHIGYVLQTPHLFSGTVLENLRYGNPNATMEEIETAVCRVNADKVIDRMEGGYNSQVGEGGDLLSTGEKQLLSFARALLADPRILVLDEATSSVDTLTEQAIQAAIGTVTKGRTSFVIAHRLSTIRGADVILVMKDGKVVERGTHQELLAQKGYYHRLYTQQFVRQSSDAAMAEHAQAAMQ